MSNEVQVQTAAQIHGGHHVPADTQHTQHWTGLYNAEDYRFRREAEAVVESLQPSAEEDSVTALKAPEQLLNPAYSICGRSVSGIADVGRGTEEASCAGMDEAPRAAAVAFWEL